MRTREIAPRGEIIYTLLDHWKLGDTNETRQHLFRLQKSGSTLALNCQTFTGPRACVIPVGIIAE